MHSCSEGNVHLWLTRNKSISMLSHRPIHHLRLCRRREDGLSGGVMSRCRRQRVVARLVTGVKLQTHISPGLCVPCGQIWRVASKLDDRGPVMSRGRYPSSSSPVKNVTAQTERQDTEIWRQDWTRQGCWNSLLCRVCRVGMTWRRVGTTWQVGC